MGRLNCSFCDFSCNKTHNFKEHTKSHLSIFVNDNFKKIDTNNINLKIKNGMDNIDQIFYININHRIERKKSIENELRKINIDKNKIQRFDAIYNEECGHIGCALSHIGCLDIAIENKYDNIIILEDDFIFSTDRETLDNKINILFKDNNWVVTLLAGKINYNLDKIKENQTIMFNSFFKRTKNCSTTSGYIVKKRYFKKLKNCFEEAVKYLNNELLIHKDIMKIRKITCPEKASSKHPGIKLQFNCSAIDVHWFKIQKNDIFYIFDPQVGKQCDVLCQTHDT